MNMILAQLAGSLVTGVARSLFAQRPQTSASFADVLEAAVASRHAAPVKHLAEDLAQLPLSSREASAVARELQNLLKTLETSGASTWNVKKALAGFVEGISRRFTLSSADTSALAALIARYTASNLPMAAGLYQPTPDA